MSPPQKGRRCRLEVKLEGQFDDAAAPFAHDLAEFSLGQIRELEAAGGIADPV